jgi:hypothetical protein
MPYGRGFIRDPHLGLYRSFKSSHPAALKALPLGLPDSVSLLPFAPPIQDQDGVGQCVGRAIASALFTVLSSKGAAPIAPFSARALYWLARAIDRADMYLTGTLPPVTDSGCSPNQAIRAAALYGLASMYEIEGDGLVCDPANANTELKAGEIIACDARRPLVQWTAVEDGDPTKISQVLQAMTTGHPVAFAMEADDAFQAYDGKQMLSYSGQNQNHMQYAVGYMKQPDGTYAILQVNSWSASWGMGGMAWVKQDSIANATFNMLIPEVVTP